MKFVRFLQASSFLAVSAVCSSSAYAQDVKPTTSTQKQGLEEIVITAQKRAETLSRAAAAVSVIGQATLDTVGARTFQDAVRTLPNVSDNGLGGTLAIRGLGTTTLGKGNGTVAVHIDGIFQTTQDQAATALYDIARVEVLRGPQGTLYGRNATAGVVNIITNNANTEKYEAFGDVSYGSWNNLLARGVVNIPLSDSFAVRLTGTYNKSDDWNHFPNGEHPPLLNTFNVRLATRVKLGDRFTWDGRVDYTRNNSLSVYAVPTYLYDTATGTFIPSTNPHDVSSMPPGTGTNGIGLIPGASVYKGLTWEQAHSRPGRLLAIRSNANYEFSDALSLNYLFGYFIQHQEPGVIAGLQPFQVSYAGTEKNKAWSNELDLHYQAGSLKGIFGLYSYEHSDFQPDQLVRIFAPTMDQNNMIQYTEPQVEQGGVNNGPTKDRTRAVFGQATFSASDRLRLSAGARYNWDRASFASQTESLCPFGSGLSAAQPNVAIAPGFFGPLAGLPLCTVFANFIAPGTFYLNRFLPGGSKDFKRFSWKGTVEYDLAPNAMAYATVATGYKAGGVGEQAAIGDARFFKPETNINYEAGIRSRLLGNTLSLNLTAFWTDYKDLQVQTTDPTNPSRIISINAGKSRSRGLEFEYAWAPTRADRLDGFATYLDGKFTDFPGVDDLTGQAKNFAGNRLPGAPKLSARASYSHIFDFGSTGTVTPTISVYYQSKAYVSFTNDLPTRINGYTQSDFIIRYETVGKHFSAEAYVNNIENKIRLFSIFPQFNVSNAFFTQPRSVGVRLGFRY